MNVSLAKKMSSHRSLCCGSECRIILVLSSETFGLHFVHIYIKRCSVEGRYCVNKYYCCSNMLKKHKSYNYDKIRERKNNEEMITDKNLLEINNF